MFLTHDPSPTPHRLALVIPHPTTAAQTFLKGALSPMSEVLAGDFDLRVPVVTAVIDSYNKLSHSDVVVELVVSATVRYCCVWHALGKDDLTNRTE